ncbi:O-antigen ligase family protein [Algoriphagus taiwanensis]|uniref:O-antigen ligase-related domain-containing protein n=1 Tax=Algoriphagus taiwanensis TaxID=1445656 RepID=A0ABQ6Q356_9BACT|nr:hypothetical protein Ataiwa_27760 [Algoriphagus taiwanensis]
MSYQINLNYLHQSRENYFLVFLIIFKSSQASVLAFSPLTTIIALLYSFYLFTKRGLKFDLFFVRINVLYILLNFAYFLYFKENDFILSIYVLLKINYAYFTIKIVKDTFFLIYENIIYILCLISLPLFLVQLINYDLLFSFLSLPQRFIPFLEYRNDRLANFVFFTLESHGSVYRNSGFAWEPKGFANFIVVAIIINLIFSNFQLNKKLFVYYIALITTTSTTAFICAFILVPFWYILNKNSRFLPLFIIVSFSFILVFLSLDFGFSKIKYEINMREEYKELLDDTREFESRSLGRFPSFIVDFNDFLKSPIFGYGFNPHLRTQSNYTKLVRVNGFSDWLATYGLIGLSVFIFFHLRFFNRILKSFHYSGVAVLFLIIFVIYFASTLTTHPFWLMVMMFAFIQFDWINAYLYYKSN